MSNVYIYYGPQKGFDEFLASKGKKREEMKGLSTLVRELDEASREYHHVVRGSEQELVPKQQIDVQDLFVLSDEYSSVREHVIINFDGFLSQFDVGNLYLHNPPEVLSKKVSRIFSNTTTIRFKYPSVTEKVIKTLHYSYGDNIIGQEKAKKNLLIALYPLLRDNFLKPVVILFYGPSGVGKTETAKYVSESLGGELFRKQLSMFQSNEFMTYLFGGHHYEKSFGKDLLERETNVILLDEFDKANPVFHNAFYQLFDEGIFVDKNYSVDIGRSIIICTSNYNSLEEIRNNLGDPIFSRFDSCIKFEQLKSEDIARIIRLRVDNEYESLDEISKSHIDKNELIRNLCKHVKRFNSARQIESIVREIISEKLLELLLSKPN